ncbi:MAG: Mur ligase domain-containing protein, partial [cyanobacterium endosymbiont of Rhopalodia yunnanensis]
MVKIRDLLKKVSILEKFYTNNSLDRQIKGICTNSHACKPGDLFIGMPGTRVDGGRFWQSAIEAGAIAAIITPQA